MTDAVASLAVDCIRPACRGEPDIMRRIEKAFAEAQDFFMSTDDSLRFRAALAAIILETPNDEEKRRLYETNDYIKALDAAMKGVDVNFPDITDPLPLIWKWHEAKDAYAKRMGR